jgi:hypothetical protein
MMRRPSADIGILVGLLVLLAVLSALMMRSGETTAPEKVPHRTSYSVKPGGYAALYRLLARRGFTTGRSERPAGDWAKSVPVIVSGPPRTRLGRTPDLWTEREAKKAVAWVLAGGTLILLAEKDNALLKAVGITVVDNDRPATQATGVARSPLLRAVRTVSVPGGARLGDLPRRATVLLRGDRGPIAASVTLGLGRVVAISSPGIADNVHLGTADNARFVAALIEEHAGPRGPIVFDEVRQGYLDSDTFLTVIGPAGQRVLWQLAVVAVLIGITAGTRFGLPLPVPVRSRVSAEYVASLADLYRGARARGAALETLRQSFRRDLARQAGAASDTDDVTLARQAALALGADEARLKALLAAVAEAVARDPQALRDDELLALAQRLSQERKDVGLGG